MCAIIRGTPVGCPSDPGALVRGGEQNQVEHRRERPRGGNHARHTVEIEVVPLLPQRKRGGEVGIGGGEGDDRPRRPEREPRGRPLAWSAKPPGPDGEGASGGGAGGGPPGSPIPNPPATQT